MNNLHKLEIKNEKDLDKFFILPAGNREISPARVKRLKEDIKRTNFISPILVNSKHQVLDGQYRLSALRELDLENKSIDYIVVPKEMMKIPEQEFIIRMNLSQANWTNKQILIKRSESDQKIYELNNLSETYRLSMNIVASLIRNKWMETSEVRSFEFKEKIRTDENMKLLGKIRSFLFDIKDICQQEGAHLTKGFVKCYIEEGYNDEIGLKILNFLGAARLGLVRSIANDAIFMFPSLAAYGKWKNLFKKIIDNSIIEEWRTEEIEEKID